MAAGRSQWLNPGASNPKIKWATNPPRIHPPLFFSATHPTTLPLLRQTHPPLRQPGLNTPHLKRKNNPFYDTSNGVYAATPEIGKSLTN